MSVYVCLYTMHMSANQILSNVIMSNDRIRISDFIEEKGIESFEKIKDFNLEGMMAKRKFSRYIQGTRSADWLKIKNIKTQDCVVIGFTKGEGNRQRSRSEIPRLDK